MRRACLRCTRSALNRWTETAYGVHMGGGGGGQEYLSGAYALMT
jgi:hypothetical protein